MMSNYDQLFRTSFQQLCRLLLVLAWMSPEVRPAAAQTHRCGNSGARTSWSAKALNARRNNELLIARKTAAGNYRVTAADELPRRDFQPAYTVSSPAGGVTFNVVYEDLLLNTNAGFDDPGAGATRIATLNAALAYVGGVLAHVGSVDILIVESETDGGAVNNFLARADAQFTFLPAEVFIQSDTFKRIALGIDAAPALDEMQIQVDFGYNWNSNHTTPPGPTQYDLFTVLLHEITHGLGFLSLTTSTGDSLLGPFCRYDDFLHSGMNTKLWDAAEVPAADIQNILLGQQLGVEFRGAGAALVAGGSGAAVYSPFVYAPGSSISHFNNFGIDPLPVMAPTIAAGISRRNYTALDLAALQDLGYSISLGSLVINELDYADAGAVDLSFIELKNNTAAALDLSDVELVGFNGANQTEYGATALVGLLAPGDYYLLATQSHSGALTGVTFDQTWGADPLSGVPAGLFLRQIGSGVILDSVSYGGGAAHPSGAPDGGDAGSDSGGPLYEALARFPDGADLNNNSLDFRLLPPTPGAPNAQPNPQEQSNFPAQLSTAAINWQWFR